MMQMDKRVLDLSNKVFGLLTVVHFDKSVPKLGALWVCKCSCGGEAVVPGKRLTHGDTRSCGCRRRKSLPDGEAARNEVYREYKSGADKRGLSFDLSVEEFENLTQRPCVYCGTEKSNRERHTHKYAPFFYNGIDRVDPTVGYNVGNCVPCCRVCNRMKSDMTKSDFLDHIARISKFKKAAIQGSI